MTFHTAAEMVAYAKAHPTKLSDGSVTVGSASRLTLEMLKLASGAHLTHVPYCGAAPALTDLIAGNIQAAFLVPGNVQQFVKDGRLKLIASSGAKRFESTPDIPTLVESGYPDLVAMSWIGFFTTAGTPRPVIDRLHPEITRILQTPEMRERLRGMEFELVASPPEYFANWIKAEIPRWGTVIKATGAKAE